MSHTMRQPIIPRAMLLGVGAVLLAAIGTAGVARVSGHNRVVMPESQVLIARDLRFDDRADRGIDIHDVNTGELVETVAPKTGGFLRGVMRGLLYDDRYGLRPSDRSPDRAFRLTQWADGRLSLDDGATGQRIELEAFGSTNRDVFAKMLKQRGPT